MANNNAILRFGADVDQNSIQKVIAKAEELTKRKYDIVFKADAKGNIETYVENYKAMIKDLRSTVINGLNNLNTSSSVEQINFLITALKQLMLALFVILKKLSYFCDLVVPTFLF